jgi:hypothetical protein
VAFHTKIKIIMNNDFPKFPYAGINHWKNNFSHGDEQNYGICQWTGPKDELLSFNKIIFDRIISYIIKHLLQMIHSDPFFLYFFFSFPILIRRVPTQSGGK